MLREQSKPAKLRAATAHVDRSITCGPWTISFTRFFRTSPLRQAFTDHRDETEEQIARLETVFEAIGKKPRGKTSEAMLGIIAEGQHVIDEVEDDAVRNGGILAAGQTAEHYEIARYGTLRAWAELLGQDEVVELLSETLEEEKHADELLSSIAEGGINESASERPQAAG